MDVGKFVKLRLISTHPKWSVYLTHILSLILFTLLVFILFIPMIVLHVKVGDDIPGWAYFLIYLVGVLLSCVCYWFYYHIVWSDFKEERIHRIFKCCMTKGKIVSYKGDDDEKPTKTVQLYVPRWKISEFNKVYNEIEAL